MSLKKIQDSEIERIIDLWKNEPVLCDVRCSRYANADGRKAALTRISHEIGLDTSEFVIMPTLANNILHISNDVTMTQT